MSQDRHIQPSHMALLLRFKHNGRKISAREVDAAMQAVGLPCPKSTARKAASNANRYGQMESVVQQLQLQPSNIILQYNGRACPHCCKHGLVVYKGPKQAWLITQDKALHKAKLRRKHCGSCGVVVGPGYYYFKGRTNRQPPARRQTQQELGAEQLDEEMSGAAVAAAVFGQAAAADAVDGDGGDGGSRDRQRVLHVSFLKGHGRESALLLANRGQRLFIQERLVEELHLQRTVCHTSTEKLCECLLMCLRQGDTQWHCGSSGLTAQQLPVPGLDLRGTWLQEVIDRLVVRQLCRHLQRKRDEQQQQQHAGQQQQQQQHTGQQQQQQDEEPVDEQQQQDSDNEQQQQPEPAPAPPPPVGGADSVLYVLQVPLTHRHWQQAADAPEETSSLGDSAGPGAAVAAAAADSADSDDDGSSSSRDVVRDSGSSGSGAQGEAECDRSDDGSLSDWSDWSDDGSLSDWSDWSEPDSEAERDTVGQGGAAAAHDGDDTPDTQQGTAAQDQQQQRQRRRRLRQAPGQGGSAGDPVGGSPGGCVSQADDGVEADGGCDAAENEAALLAACAAAGVPVGTAAQLLRQMVVTPFKENYGNIAEASAHCCIVDCCNSSRSGGQQDVPVLLVDATKNVQLRACAVPGCRQEPLHGNATWCAAHAQVSQGCHVVMQHSSSDADGGGEQWEPCPCEPEPHSTTCSTHAHLDQQYGAAAGYEAHGALAKPTPRWDKVPAGGVGDAAALLAPHTPSPPQGSRCRQGLAGRRGSNTLPPFNFAAPPGSNHHHHQQQQQQRHQSRGTAGLSAGVGLRSSPVAGFGAGGEGGGGQGGDDDPAGDEDQDDEVSLYVRPRCKRDILAVTCAKCGLVLGSSLLWSGAQETSPRGLNDVLTAVRGILQHQQLLPSAGQPAPPHVVLVYNDAGPMTQHLAAAAAAPGHLKAAMQGVLWSIDPFRFMPKHVGVYNTLAAARQQQQQLLPVSDAEAAAAGPSSVPAGAAHWGSQASSPAAAAVGAAVAAAEAARDQLLSVSPFRQELQHQLWQRVAVNATSTLGQALQQLLQQMPRTGDLSSADARAAAASSTAVASLLRHNGVRLQSGGAVSWKEMQGLLAGVLGRKVLRDELLAGLKGLTSTRLFFVFDWKADSSRPTTGSEDRRASQMARGTSTSTAQQQRGTAAAAAAGVGMGQPAVRLPQQQQRQQRRHQQQRQQQPQRRRLSGQFDGVIGAGASAAAAAAADAAESGAGVSASGVAEPVAPNTGAAAVSSDQRKRRKRKRQPEAQAQQPGGSEQQDAGEQQQQQWQQEEGHVPTAAAELSGEGHLGAAAAAAAGAESGGIRKKRKQKHSKDKGQQRQQQQCAESGHVPVPQAHIEGEVGMRGGNRSSNGEPCPHSVKQAAGAGARDAELPGDEAQGNENQTAARAAGRAAAAAAAAGGGPFSSGRWRVFVIEVLVDCEALEQLWARLQPGNTLHLKTQVHGIVQLWSWLELFNRQTALRVADTWEAFAGRSNPYPDQAEHHHHHHHQQQQGYSAGQQQQQQEEDEGLGDVGRLGQVAVVGQRPLSRTGMRTASQCRSLVMVRGGLLHTQLVYGTNIIN